MKSKWHINSICIWERFKYGPIVYRLGRQVFILESRVRLPVGLQWYRRTNFLVSNRTLTAWKDRQHSQVAKLVRRYIFWKEIEIVPTLNQIKDFTGSNPVLTTIYYTQVRLCDHQKLLGFFTVHIYIKGLL